jgi:hypothetical protein
VPEHRNHCFPPIRLLRKWFSRESTPKTWDNRELTNWHPAERVIGVHAGRKKSSSEKFRVAFRRSKN